MTAREWANERPWVFWSALILAAAVALWAVLWVMTRHSKTLAEKQNLQLERVLRGAERARVLKANAAKRAGVAGPGTLDWPKIRDLAVKQNISEDQMNPNIYPRKLGDNVSERIVVVTIERINRQPLSRFIKSVEESDPAIRTKNLKITRVSRIIKPDLRSPVDAKVEFSAYERNQAVATQPK